MPYYMGCMMDTGLGTSAYLQTACALRDMSYGAALPGPLMLSDDILTSPIAYKDSCVIIPTGMGLGVQVDWEKVEKLAAT